MTCRVSLLKAPTNAVNSTDLWKTPFHRINSTIHLGSNSRRASETPPELRAASIFSATQEEGVITGGDTPRRMRTPVPLGRGHLWVRVVSPELASCLSEFADAERSDSRLLKRMGGDQTSS